MLEVTENNMDEDDHPEPSEPARWRMVLESLLLDDLGLAGSVLDFFERNRDGEANPIGPTRPGRHWRLVDYVWA